jgi:hypothetical protein
MRVVQALSQRSDLSEEIWLVGANGHRFLEISEKVKVLGVLDSHQLKTIYQTAWYLVSATLNEAFGLTIAEAANQGLPALVKSGSGSEEFVLNHKSGLIFLSTDELKSLPLPELHSTLYSDLSKKAFDGSLNHAPLDVASSLLNRLGN